MFGPDPKEKARRRKASWIMALACGPAMAVTFIITFWICSLFRTDSYSAHESPEGTWMKIAGGISLGAAAAIGDPLSKRLRVSVMDYSGPVAFSCMLFGVIVLIIVCAIRSI